jgi:serralysin
MATTTFDTTIVTNNPYMIGLIGDSGATPGVSPEEVTIWNKNSPITYFLAPGDFNSDGTNDWAQHGATAAIQNAFASWAKVADITFQQVNTAAAANLVENINDAGGSLGDHTLPDASNHSVGNFALNATWAIPNNNSIGGYSYKTLVHELGHALGLEHPHVNDGDDAFPGVQDGPNAEFTDMGDNGLNQGIWTIMSYVDGWDQGGGINNGGTSSRPFGWEATPMAFDIAAIQLLYGANMATNTGNTNYILPKVNGVGTYWSCIWDAGGTADWISAGAGTATAVAINLNDATLQNEVGGGGFVSRQAGILGGFTIANGVVIENARGGGGNDVITGNEFNNLLYGGAGRDTILGGNGNDTLVGEAGADTLKGEAGNDIYNLGSDVAGDTLNDSAGIDSVLSTVTRSMAGYVGVEYLYLQGVANINGAGNTLNNLIVGNTGNNVMHGGGGQDTLRGAFGTDSQFGDAGNDRFQFVSALDSVVGPGRDVIGDFDKAGMGNDIIDMTILVPGVGSFIGNALFSAPGQVRVQQAGPNVLVQINLSGNGVAESEILITGVTLGFGVGQVGPDDFLM